MRALTRHCEASDMIVRCFSFVSWAGERGGREADSPGSRREKNEGNATTASVFTPLHI